MPLFGQFGRQPDADDVAHLLFRDHLAAERQHIRAIMFAAVSCRGFVVTHRRSNTSDFVGDHAGTDLVHDLPELKDILEETYGVILYQEQVMQIANRLAGFSLGEADILRRAMGKKNRDEMAAQREKFLTGCAVHKVPPKKAERISNSPSCRARSAARGVMSAFSFTRTVVPAGTVRMSSSVMSVLSAKSDIDQNTGKETSVEDP